LQVCAGDPVRHLLFATSGHADELADAGSMSMHDDRTAASPVGADRPLHRRHGKSPTRSWARGGSAGGSD